MAARRHRVTAPELEQFVVLDVRLTEISLGVGAYGSVEEVEIPGARVAAKKLHTQLINLGSPQQVQKWVTDFVEECKLMSQLRHPHIVQFLGVAYLPGSPIPVLLMEKLQTSLDNLLETSPKIPLDVKVHLLTGAAQGVVYLHSHTPPIAHRDLTARNILIDSGLTAKIADLGVARMVNIQPGQLAATMTAGPGNNLYMPPETVQEEGATRYNTAIDIFSFGVVSLFTLTQTFPKDLKPHNYRDPVTRRLVGRTEIERREDYIQLMNTALGETHPLVKLTLDCLEHFPEDRPSALEILRRSEAVGRTVPLSYTVLGLIQHISEKEEHTEQVQEERHRAQLREQEELQRQLSEKDRQLLDRDAQINRLQVNADRIQAEKQEQVRGLEELTSLQQQQLEAQRKEIDRLSGQLQSMKLQPQEERSQGSKQRSVPDTKKPTLLSSSITLNWRRCKDRPRMNPYGSPMSVYSQPVPLNGKLYMNGRKSVAHEDVMTVLEYAPIDDQWTELPPPPVNWFTIATLRGQLLVVGGWDKSTRKVSNTIFAYDAASQVYSGRWIQPYSAMPIALTTPAVIEYQDHLIITGGRNYADRTVIDVNILDAVSNKWKTAQPGADKKLFSRTLIRCVVSEHTIYLQEYGENQVLRAHLPTLVSGAKSGVWEPLTNTPYYDSSLVTIGSFLLTLGGSDKPRGGKPTTSIQMYNPTTNQWTKVGDLPETVKYPYCVIMNSELFIFRSQSQKLLVSTLPHFFN